MSWWRAIYKSVRYVFAAVLAFFLLFVSAGCGGNASYSSIITTPQLHFVSSGLCITGLQGFEKIDRIFLSDGGPWRNADFSMFGDVLLVPRDWKSGKTYRVRIEGSSGVQPRSLTVGVDSPKQPGLALLNIVPLQPHLGSFQTDGKEVIPTACAVSSCGEWCALGTNLGGVCLLSLPDGTLRASLYFTGAYIRCLAFAETSGGLLLLVGEQSPRGSLSTYSLDPRGNLKHIWSYDASKDLGTSAYDVSDPFSWAHLPGIYRIIVLPDGDLFALATHSSGEGSTPRQSLLYRFRSDDGHLRWAWPEISPLNATATWCDSSLDGRTVVLCAYGYEEGSGRLSFLNGNTGQLSAQQRIEPLRPYLEQVSFWRSVALSPDGSRLAAISDDGRAWLWNLQEESAFISLNIAEPLNVEGLPLIISGSAVVASSSDALIVTGTSYTPWHLTGGKLPPHPHPDALQALNFGWDGKLKWAVPIPNLAQGVVMPAYSQWVFLGYSSDPQFSPGGGSGLFILHAGGSRASIAAAYSVGGGVMHGAPLVARGGNLILLIERAQRDRTGERLLGANALHILYW